MSIFNLTILAADLLANVGWTCVWVVCAFGGHPVCLIGKPKSPICGGGSDDWYWQHVFYTGLCDRNCRCSFQNGLVLVDRQFLRVMAAAVHGMVDWQFLRLMAVAVHMLVSAV